MRKFSFFAILMLLNGPGLLGSSTARAEMVSRYTPYELDILEAHLNKQWKRVEEVATSHAKFVAIRQDLIINGYERDITAWHTDITNWLASWDAILTTMSGSDLIDAQIRKDTTAQVDTQLRVLEALTQKIMEIRKKGDDAMAALNALPRYPGDYIDVIETSNDDTYRDQIALYAQQIDTAQQNMQKAQAAFTVTLTNKLKAISTGLQGALVSRMTSLAIGYPHLEEAVAETKAALDQMRLVDMAMDRLEEERAIIYREIGDQAFFTARAHIAAWKLKGDAVVRDISANPSVNTVLRQYARDIWDTKARGTDAFLKNTQGNLSDVRAFAQYYTTQLYGSMGLVEQCLQTTRPRTVDCNLVRVVQGFRMAQLMRLKSEQAAYIEGLIVKAKKGVMRPKS